MPQPRRPPLECAACASRDTTTTSPSPSSSASSWTPPPSSTTTTTTTTTATVWCGPCVSHALSRAQDRHAAALAAWKEARQACEDHCRAKQQHSSQSQPPSQSQPQSQSSSNSHRKALVLYAWPLARQTLEEDCRALRQACARQAVATCAARIRTEAKTTATIQKDGVHRSSVGLERLQRLERSMLWKDKDDSDECGALPRAIQSTMHTVRTTRFAWAVQAFLLHRLQIEDDGTTTVRHPAHTSGSQTTTTTATAKVVRGIGKIGGLPLPHAGTPELLGVLPAQELQSALRLVAQLVQLVSQCLGILLPHPIVLQPATTTTNTTTNTTTAQPSASHNHNNNHHHHHHDVAGQDIAAMAAAAVSVPGAADAAVGSLGTPSLPWRTRSSTTGVPPSMDPAKVDERVRHAVSALVLEDRRPHATTYALTPILYAEPQPLPVEAANSGHGSTATTTTTTTTTTSTSGSSNGTTPTTTTPNEEFSIALQLLQNNSVALCMRAGVPVGDLWPGEAVLLNLHALYEHCCREGTVGS